MRPAPIRRDPIMLSDRFLFVAAALVTMAFWVAWDRERIAGMEQGRPARWSPRVVTAIVGLALLLPGSIGPR
jgi:hypothetical protein